MPNGFNIIEGGVTAPKGFQAASAAAGIKYKNRTDMALIYSETPCVSAGVYTTNVVKAAPVLWDKAVTDSDVKVHAVVVNSGIANACTGQQGMDICKATGQAVADIIGGVPENVLVGSTGVIGMQIDTAKIVAGTKELMSKKAFGIEAGTEASKAIMTTDTINKEIAVSFELGGKTVTLGAMSKGSGMIHINMGTMISFVTTDCAISSDMLNKALKETVKGTYNCVSIDGDMSTNDTLTIMANGLAGNEEITCEGADFDAFLKALNVLNTQMAMKIAADGEGASHLVECTVKGAKDVETARGLAKFVIKSNLVKAAMFGRDANCGRIMCAMGYSGFDFDPDKACVYFSSRKGSKRYFDTPEEDKFQVYGCDKCGGRIEVVHNGVGLSFDEEKATSILAEEAVEIEVVLQDGNAEGTAWGCDLTYDYVKINGDYRS